MRESEWRENLKRQIALGLQAPLQTLDAPIPHEGQRRVELGAKRFTVLACGRRWGKTTLGIRRHVPHLQAGYPTAWFAPTYKLLLEVWREAKIMLKPITAKVSEQEHRIELTTGGSMDFWTCDGQDPARGRKYRHATVDEAAMIPNLKSVWEEAIRPSLSDYEGSADILSTPKGRNFFFQLFHRKGDDWTSFTEPTVNNPYIKPEEVEAAKGELTDKAFRQEYLAEFIEDDGLVFRNVTACVRGSTNRGTSFGIGVDLARKEDFTVFSVFNEYGEQQEAIRFNNTSWEYAVQQGKLLDQKYPNTIFFMDSTGVGDPIVEAFEKAGLNVRPYVFTSVSKQRLIENLQLGFENNQVTLVENDDQLSEILTFEESKTATGRPKYSAPEGMHDDYVIAAALGYWGVKQSSSDKRFDIARFTKVTSLGEPCYLIGLGWSVRASESGFQACVVRVALGSETTTQYVQSVNVREVDALTLKEWVIAEAMNGTATLTALPKGTGIAVIDDLLNDPTFSKPREIVPIPITGRTKWLMASGFVGRSYSGQVKYLPESEPLITALGWYRDSQEDWDGELTAMTCAFEALRDYRQTDSYKPQTTILRGTEEYYSKLAGEEEEYDF